MQLIFLIRSFFRADNKKAHGFDSPNPVSGQTTDHQAVCP